MLSQSTACCFQGPSRISLATLRLPSVDTWHTTLCEPEENPLVMCYILTLQPGHPGAWHRGREWTQLNSLHPNLLTSGCVPVPEPSPELLGRLLPLPAALFLSSLIKPAIRVRPGVSHFPVANVNPQVCLCLTSCETFFPVTENFS